MQDTFYDRTQTKFKRYLFKIQVKNVSRNCSFLGCKAAAEGMLRSEQGEEGDPVSGQGVWEQHWGSWSTTMSKLSAGLLGWDRAAVGAGIAAVTTCLCSGCFHR